MTKCDFCINRHSWDCDDGLPYPDNGCESFTLDKETLTDEEKRLLIIFDIIKENKHND